MCRVVVVAMLILQAAKDTVAMSILLTLAASDAMHCLLRPVQHVIRGKYNIVIYMRHLRDLPYYYVYSYNAQCVHVVHISYFC